MTNRASNKIGRYPLIRLQNIHLRHNHFHKLSLRKMTLAILLTFAVSSCATIPMTGVDATADIPEAGEKYDLGSSYLQGDDLVEAQQNNADNATSASELDAASINEHGQIHSMTSMSRDQVNLNKQEADLRFDDTNELTVTVNDMPLKSFLHYAFGELLAIDYVIGEGVSDNKVTLNVANKITARKLFEVSTQVLQQQGVGLRYNDGIYYVYQLPTGQKSSTAMGFGRRLADVPQNAGEILQIVPLKYGVKMSVQNTLLSLIDAKVTQDYEQGALFIQGDREQIVRAIELIRLLDVPSYRGKYISMISPTYISLDEFTLSLTKLLKTEGIDVADAGLNRGSVSFVSLPQLGAITVFSPEKDLLDRVEYWAQQIDKPSKGTDRQYHIYVPKLARASDLGESIAPLISGVASPSAPNGLTAKDTKDSALMSANTDTSKNINVSSNDKMTMVVDERSNSLIFYSTGSEYQAMLPLIRRMDILPKQVLLNVTIAEVKLTGEFKRGFEFALNSGKFSATTKGNLGLSDIAGATLGWASGAEELLGKFIDQNSQVNILSKPSLLVRDGTEASINVGDKIPVSSGSSTSGSGDVITENISYRETGIKLKVKPTVNAQGVVIMVINQEISNQLAGQVGKGDNPVFFERSLSTEVVAESGQTILLGGLISEDSSNSNTGVPFLKTIPLLGALFESESKSKNKTELVIMVTPKIVERAGQWQGILNQFQKALNTIDLQQ